MSPEKAMRLALAQARRARGRTFPNPPVGAVVVRGDRVLGRGHTRPVGGPHAEVVAIRAAARRHGERALRGASMAVTLEPCSHVGRTGPCADLLVESGIARVWVGHLDPQQGPGRGLRRLRRAGLDVAVGVLADACREQHRGFLSVVERGRPFVVLKLAASLDGRIATASGESRWITGSPARDLVHRLRRRVDAVMVGASTALADDPELTGRSRGRVVHRPIRVVADARLVIPPGSKLIRGEPASAWVLCGGDAPRARRRALEEAGARVLEIPSVGRRLDLRRGLRRLAREGLTEVLVEGGGRLGAELVRRRLVDEVHWFAAPRLLGSEGLPALGPLGVRRLPGAPALVDLQVRRLGADVYLRGRLAPGRERR